MSSDVSSTNIAVNCHICNQQCFLKDLKKHFQVHSQEGYKGKSSPLIEYAKSKEISETKTKRAKNSNKMLKTFSCNICGKNFTTKQYCQIHWLNIHGNQKGFKCGQCESSFPDQKALNNHNKYVHKPNDVECKFCNKHLKTERNLKIHIQDVHETKDPKTIQCEKCSKPFYNQKRLQIHFKRVHENANLDNYKCEFCKKSFCSSLSKKRHIEGIHENKRIFKCLVCFKGFIFKENLKEHMDDIHERKDKDACKFCGKTFSRNRILKRHILIAHSNSKQFQRRICDKSFALMQYLKIHLSKVHKITNKEDDNNDFSMSEVCKRIFFKVRTNPA